MGFNIELAIHLSKD